jgi:hypothetical protein
MRGMRHACFVALVLFSSSAFAGRALVEPPGIARVVKGANRAEITRVLALTNTADVCADALSLPGDLLGVRCRAAVSSHIMANKPLATPADVDARTAYVKDLAALAVEVHTYAPLDPPPDLTRARYHALKAIGEALMKHHSALSKASAKPELVGEVKTSACDTTQRALDIIKILDDISADEKASLQSLITSHRCFLDESRLASTPKPLALTKSSDASALRASTSDEGILREYAQTRAIDLDRCKKHFDAGNNIKDKPKLSECLCGAVQRWKFPPRASATSTTLAFQTVNIPVAVDQHGGVTSCGPLP